jgi:DNA-binding FadR family transcriptional regulator
MVNIHKDVCERLRIIRRLDFTQSGRIEATYNEHSEILEKICAGDADLVTQDLRHHIEISKNTVRDITLHRIQDARNRYAVDMSMK